MIHFLIEQSVKNKLIVGLLVLAMAAAGLYSLGQLPLDAVPDITNNQVQVVTISPTLAPQEVEQFITYPIELSMANLPKVEEVRSLSRYGLSVVTIVFEESYPMLDARQLVREQIDLAAEEIPPGYGMPELMPITTGLGEIYQYVLQVKPGYEDQYDAMELRTIQDWIVKRQLAGTKGIIEISSFGGYLKQYEVAVDPILLQSLNLSIADVFGALERNNQNTGGSYIEKGSHAYYIRSEGLIKNLKEIESIQVAQRGNTVLRVSDLATVDYGHAPRFGAMTMDGKGEVVGGIALMLKGANSSETIRNVQERIAQIQKSLPEGVELYAYLDRSVLVGKAIDTVKKNLLEGGAIVMFILFLLLGNFRASLIVASVIPLAMLFAVILMYQFGVSANLMSLGAIDFGIVVDGAVIVVEGVLHTLFAVYAGRELTRQQMDSVIIEQSSAMFRSAVFGVFVILIVFVPILTLTGIEGKMFRPMALTFGFAIIGALILSLTYVPMVSALILPRKIKVRRTLSDRIVNLLRSAYKPSLEMALRFPKVLLGMAALLLLGSFLIFRSLGSEFIPTLEEGDLAMQMTIPPGSSLQESIRTSTKAEKILLDKFPEVKHVVSKIGTAEVPTDPMAIEDADIMIILEEKSAWVSANDREALADSMKLALNVVAGAMFEFTQPIQLRFNELMTGAKGDVAVKIFGDDTDSLKVYADRAAQMIASVPGAADVKVEQTDGLPQLKIEFDRTKLAQYGLDIETMNTIVRTAFAGASAGVIFENERRFDLVLRLPESYRKDLNLERLFVPLPNGSSVPMSELALVRYVEGPMQISRENTRRRIVISINVRNRDIAGLVGDIQSTLGTSLNLPPGYTIQYGGEFENLQRAERRLMLAVPAALALIFILLYLAFGNTTDALLIFSTVPMSAVGGILALWLRDMPFSISAGVGFIALFGVATLNGIVLVSYFRRLRFEEKLEDVREVVLKGSLARMRPVIMTALVAAFGFLPMAISVSNGAEVQRPLATVVIGGIFTATLLTLLLVPVLYWLLYRTRKHLLPIVALLIALPQVLPSQTVLPANFEEVWEQAAAKHPDLQGARILEQWFEQDRVLAREIPATEFSMEGAQINSRELDYRFSVVQSFGNPGMNRLRRERADQRLRMARQETQLLRYALRADVAEAWYRWYYAIEVDRQLKRQRDLVQELLENARLQHELGAIHRLDLLIAEQAANEVERSSLQAAQALESAYRNLRIIAFLDTDPLPPETAMEPLEPAIPVDAQAFFLQVAEQQQTLAEAEQALAERAGRPTVSVGYFNQSIRPDIPLQGVLLGVSAPLYRKPLQARRTQAALELDLTRLEYQHQQQQYREEQTRAAEAFLLLKEEMDVHGRELGDIAESLRDLALIQRQAGEIDYYRYLEIVRLAQERELELLELTQRYNLALIRLLYLSNQL